MKKRISFALALFISSYASLALADYRIAYSGDGNQHDADDWHASSLALAMIAESGNKWRLVHFDYNNHLGNNDWQMAQKHRNNVDGAIQRYGYDRSRFFDNQSNLWGSVNSIANAINNASAGNRLYLICAGPMEVCYRGINAAQDWKEQYVTVISHSWWNENHDDTWELKHKWADIQRDFNVRTVEIADQNNTAFRSKPWAWDWLKNQNHGTWLHQAVAQDISGGDASDSGMVYYVLKGLASSAQWASMNDIKGVFSGGSVSPDSGGGGSSGGTVTPPGSKVGIVARNSWKCPQVKNWSGANGANIEQWSCASWASNQKWKFEKTWGGRYALRNQHSYKCLEVAGKSWSDGANVDQWYCHKGPHQQFDLIDKGNGWFNLKVKHSGKCVTVANGSNWNGANVVQQSCHGGWNQQFRFKW